MILDTDSLTEIRDAIRSWVEMLAQGRFDDAAAALTTTESQCSTALLRSAVGRYSRKYREAPEDEKWQFVPAISSPSEMDKEGETLVLYVKTESTIVEYDLPIAGDWSDLTAKFYLKKYDFSRVELSLIDIRVL